MFQPQPRRVDPKIWQHCAGASVKTPKLNSRVYYFPQGHLEHACPSPNTQALSLLYTYHRPSIPCIISSVDLLADPHTDEVFAKLLLTPITDSRVQQPTPGKDDDKDKVVSFTKVLTQSDSNNGGGFSVPKACANSVLPPLDISKVLASQILNVCDVQGKVWTYTHVYCGTPLRHLFTTGWTEFVNNKKLNAGDSVVFMKNSAGNLFVGIRREGGGFSRCEIREKITENAVMEAVELAEKNMAFEVVYYPNTSWCDFVVDENVVDEAIKLGWNSGMRVKFCLKLDDSKKNKLIESHGTISGVSNVPIWRMLQVNWDEPTSQNPKCVNPWQVELLSRTPALHLPIPPTKRPRVGQCSTMPSDTDRNAFIPTTGFASSTILSSNQTLLNYITFPAVGMQGARHEYNFLPSSSNFMNDEENIFLGNNPMVGPSNVSTEQNAFVPTTLFTSSRIRSSIQTTLNCSTFPAVGMQGARHEYNFLQSSSNFMNDKENCFSGNSSMSGPSNVSTELTIGTPTFVDSSPHNHISLNSGKIFAETHNNNKRKASSGSLRLFGVIIQPVERNLHDFGINGKDENKSSNDFCL